MNVPGSQERLLMYEHLVRGMHAASSPREVLDLFEQAMGMLRGRLAYVELLLDGAEADARCGPADARCGPADARCGPADADHGLADPAREVPYRVTRFRRHDGTEVVPDRSPFLPDGAVLARGGLFGRVAAGTPRAFLETDLTLLPDDPFAGHLADYTAMLAAPIYTAGRPEWVIFLSQDPEQLRSIEIDEFLLRVNLVGAVIHAMTTAERLAQATARIQSEISRIAAIQRALLPAEAPVHPSIDVAFWVESSECAGGDLIDLGGHDGDRFGLLIADASGHGPSAAVVAAMVCAIVRAFPQPLGDPAAGPVQPLREIADVLVFANDHLCEKRIEQNFVTALVAAYRRSTGMVHYACAGHPMPLLCRGGQVFPLPGRGGLPLGILPGQTYSSFRFALQPGDLLVAYTDGISEAASPDGELFGAQRIAELLPGCRSAEQAVRTIRDAVVRFTGNAPRADDQTLLALYVR